MCLLDGVALTARVVAELCLEKFHSLPKTGKPTKQEWTVLAGIVQYNTETKHKKVIALGCGTKCIGPSKLCAQGQILNDSHAEVLARRALLRYIYCELQKAINSKDSIFNFKKDLCRFMLKPTIEFHFCCTQTPCGDACIAAQETDDEFVIPIKRAHLDITSGDIGAPIASNDHGIFTGAKLIGEEHNDLMKQTIGALRTKPGRGERTLSMSCSDKISKWNIIGIQGALLDSLLSEPIYLKSYNFCCENINHESLERAIWKRWSANNFSHERYQAKKPIICIITDLKFVYAQQQHLQPSPNGLTWCDIVEDLKPYEVSVNGKKQGVTKLKLQLPEAALAISKHKLGIQFLKLLRSNDALAAKANLNDKQKNSLSYAECKAISQEYQDAWKNIKCTYFQQWTKKKKSLLEFTLNLEAG